MPLGLQGRAGSVGMRIGRERVQERVRNANVKLRVSSSSLDYLLRHIWIIRDSRLAAIGRKVKFPPLRLRVTPVDREALAKINRQACKEKGNGSGL